MLMIIWSLERFLHFQKNFPVFIMKKIKKKKYILNFVFKEIFLLYVLLFAIRLNGNTLHKMKMPSFLKECNINSLFGIALSTTTPTAIDCPAENLTLFKRKLRKGEKKKIPSWKKKNKIERRYPKGKSKPP